MKKIINTVVILIFAVIIIQATMYLTMHPKISSFEAIKGGNIIEMKSDFFTDNETKIEINGKVQVVRLTDKLYNQVKLGDTIK